MTDRGELERLCGADRMQSPTRQSSNWDVWYNEFTARERHQLAGFMGGSLSPDTLATWLHTSVDDALRQWKTACLGSLKSEQLDPIDADEWQDAATVAALADIVGPQEVAERLGVQVNTVHQWRKRGVLPRPARVISTVPLWSTGTIDAWALATGRLELEEIPAF